MTEAEKLLKMIEEVDPKDSDTLDEIDCRVEHWRNWQRTTIDRVFPADDLGVARFTTTDGRTLYAAKYTRSRDALKAARPEGWQIQIREIDFCFDCLLRKPKALVNVNRLPTEHLSELHAIIQAIEWEKENAN